MGSPPLNSCANIGIKPLLVRQAISGFKAPIPRARLLAMAGEEDGVESRLIQQLGGDNWKLSHGPLSRHQPALTKPGWTVLVQGIGHA